jgi:hypothetical protein
MSVHDFGQSVWQVYRKALERMFFRYYAGSIARPWIKTPESACNDAIYRMSILVAAPFVLCVAICGLLLIIFDPLGPIARQRAAVGVGEFILPNIFTYFILRSLFSNCTPTAQSTRNGGAERKSDFVIDVVGGASVLGYVIVFVASASYGST